MEITRLLQESRNILVIKLRYLGDSVWAIPFLENLKKNLGNVKLSIMANAGTERVFYGCPAVDNVIAFPHKEIKASGIRGALRFFSVIRSLRELGPDTVIDLTDSDRAAWLAFLSGASTRVTYTHQNRWRNRLFTHVIRPKRVGHMAEYHLDFLKEMGLGVFDETIRIKTGPEAFESLKKKCPSLFQDSRKPKILIHPGARIPLRQWGADKFASLCDALSDDFRVFLVAGPGESKLLGDIAARTTKKPEFVSDKLSFDEFAALCEMADLFIGNDSGPIHIASTKTFTIGLYGPNTDRLSGPWNGNKFVFEVQSLSCRPCRQKECVNPEPKACLNQISVEEVAEKAREVLASRAAHLLRNEIKSSS